MPLSVHTVLTRRCNHDMRFPKVNQEVAKGSLFIGAMDLNGLPCHIESKESFIEFSRDTNNNNNIYAG